MLDTCCVRLVVGKTCNQLYVSCRTTEHYFWESRKSASDLPGAVIKMIMPEKINEK